MMYGDSLLISGEIGRDSLGLSGFFVFRTDTFGNIGLIKFFRDSSLMDHALLDGRNPIMKNHSNNIVLGGVFLQRDDLFAMELGSDLSIKMYKEYFANYVTMYIHDVEEIFGCYYFLGYIQTQNGDHDVFLQKIDSSGNKLWEKTYGTPTKDETGRAVVIEDEGLTIMVSESFDNTPNIENDTRYWIRFMHVDTSGAIVRDWREEVTDYEGWAGTLLKYNKDYIYTSNTIGDEIGIGPLTGGQIVRRDSAFNLVWRKKLGEPDSPFTGLGDMIFSADSCLLVTGQNVDSSMTFNAARIMKLGLDGNVMWELRDTGYAFPDGQSLNFMEGIASPSCNSIYAVGYTYKNAGFYEGLLLKVAGDGCIDTLCTTTDIEELIHLHENQVLMYPNPASTEFRIRLSEDVHLPINVWVCDMHGRRIKSVLMNQYLETIDISGLPNGIYHVLAEHKGLIVRSQAMVKMK